MTPAGGEAITFTLESGRQVTVHPVKGTCILPNGVFLADCYVPEGPAYFIPSPALVWEVIARLGLNNDDAEEQGFNNYLLELESIVEAAKTDEAVTLTCIGRSGERHFYQFKRNAKLRVEWDAVNFTRYPIRVFLHEGQGDDLKIVGFRVDHTPEGYEALAVLGWDASLRDLEEVQPLRWAA